MNVKTFPLDWRSTQALIDQQVDTINAAMKSVTILQVAAVHEFAMMVFEDTPPKLPTKIRVFDFAGDMLDKGGSTVEQEFSTFLSSISNLTQLIHLDGGAILILYS